VAESKRVTRQRFESVQDVSERLVFVVCECRAESLKTFRLEAFERWLVNEDEIVVDVVLSGVDVGAPLLEPLHFQWDIEVFKALVSTTKTFPPSCLTMKSGKYWKLRLWR